MQATNKHGFGTLEPVGQAFRRGCSSIWSKVRTSFSGLQTAASAIERQVLRDMQNQEIFSPMRKEVSLIVIRTLLIAKMQRTQQQLSAPPNCPEHSASSRHCTQPSRYNPYHPGHPRRAAQKQNFAHRTAPFHMRRRTHSNSRNTMPPNPHCLLRLVDNRDRCTSGIAFFRPGARWCHRRSRSRLGLARRTVDTRSESNWWRCRSFLRL